MRRAEIGSRPENGSSQSRITGSRTMARASAARFTMPPGELAREQLVDVLQSDGLDAGVHGARRSRRHASGVCSRSGNARLSKTVSESSSAPCWNIMPSFFRTRYSSALGELRDVLAVDHDRSGLRPHEAADQCAAAVLLPEPLPPRITEMRSRGNRHERSRKDLAVCRTPRARATARRGARPWGRERHA